MVGQKTEGEEKQIVTITFVNNNCSNGKPLLYRYMKLGVVNIILLVSNRVHYISIIIHIMINMELNTQLARPGPSLLFGCIMYENILTSWGGSLGMRLHSANVRTQWDPGSW